MTQPLAKKWECNGSNVPKETLVSTTKRNLVELCAAWPRARPSRKHGAPEQAWSDRSGQHGSASPNVRRRSYPYAAGAAEGAHRSRAVLGGWGGRNRREHDEVRERHGRGSVASIRVQRRAGRRRAAGDGTDGGGPECAPPAYHDIGRFHCRRSCRSRCWRPCRFHCWRPCRFHCRRPCRFHCRRPCRFHCRGPYRLLTVPTPLPTTVQACPAALWREHCTSGDHGKSGVPCGLWQGHQRIDDKAVARRSILLPQQRPRASGAETANDGKAPERHQDGTDQHPRCTSRPKPPGDRTGRTWDVEDSEGIDKYRGGLPDRLFAASLATSTSPRGHAGTTRELSFGARKHGAPIGLAHRASPPPGGSVISNREAGTTSSILDRGGPANHRGLMTKSRSEMTYLVLY